MSEEDEKTATKRLRIKMKRAKTATMNQFDLAKLGMVKLTSRGNLYEPTSKGTITHEGFLFKKSPGGIPLMRHWHKRWFVLESPGKLLYYSDKTKIDLKGIIPLDMIEKMLFRATRLTLLMEGSTEGAAPRKFSLKGDSDDVVKTWGAMINKAFEELDRLEDEEEEDPDQKEEPVDGVDLSGKYWKVENRKKLNLSVSLPNEDKPKKKGPAKLKIDPRAKEIEAEIAGREAGERKKQVEEKDPHSVASSVNPAAAGYMPLEDSAVAVAPPSASSSSYSSSSPDQERDAAVSAAIAAQKEAEAAALARAEKERHIAAQREEEERLALQRQRELERQIAEQEERERLERQRARQAQEEADLAAAIAASQLDQPAQPELVDMVG